MTKLEERISELVDYSGCVSGDCPHKKWADCADAYKKSIKDFILDLPELKGLIEALEKYTDDAGEIHVSIPFDELDSDDFPIIEEFESGEPNDLGTKAKEALAQWRSFTGEANESLNPEPKVKT